MQPLRGQKTRTKYQISHKHRGSFLNSPVVSEQSHNKLFCDGHLYVWMTKNNYSQFVNDKNVTEVSG